MSVFIIQMTDLVELNNFIALRSYQMLRGGGVFVVLYLHRRNVVGDSETLGPLPSLILASSNINPTLSPDNGSQEKPSEHIIKSIDMQKIYDEDGIRTHALSN